MKKYLLWFICAILVFSIVACSSEIKNKPEENNGTIGSDGANEEQTTVVDEVETTDKEEETTENNILSLDIGYIENLMVDVAQAKGFGIKRESQKKKTESNIKKTSPGTINTILRTSDDSDFNSSKDAQDEKIERCYLYATTEEINNGEIEFDGTSVKRVSFRLSSEATDVVRDCNGNVITETAVITQEDIPAQVNRVYVTDEFTFIQFVPLVSKSGDYHYMDDEGNLQSEVVVLRPDALVYDENGVAEFDKSGYYSGALSESFVISNSTGYVYRIKDIKIDGFINGLLSVNKSYYRIFVKNSKLYIEDVLPNKDVTVSNVVKDNYGWIFVANDKIDDIDATDKIIYTTDRFVWKDKNNNIYQADKLSNTSMPFIKYEYINGEKEIFKSDKLVRGINTIFKNVESPPIIATCSDLRIFDGNLYTPNGRQFSSNLFVTNQLATQKIDWFDDEFDCITCLTQDGILSYSFVDIFTDSGTTQTLTKEDFTIISSKRLTKEHYGYYQKIGENKYLLDNVYSFAGINGTEYYQLIKNENSLVLKEIEKVEYANNVYIFQPINKI